MKILGSLVLIISIAFADFQVFLEKNPIYSGEPAQLHLKATGQKILLPNLQKVGSYPVADSANIVSQQIFNGHTRYTQEKIFTFYPDTNTTIGPLEAVIDGKKVQSKPIRLIVKPSSGKNANILFEMKVNKKEAYVGDPIVAELILKIRRTLRIVDYSFEPPKFSNFWVKELKSSNKYLEEHGEYLVKRIQFLLFPQKSSVLKIPPAVFKYAVASKTRDLFGFSITAPKWYQVVSNPVQIIVKALPQPVDIVGHFSLNVRVDKKEIHPNEPINLVVTIDGYGNLENFDGFDLNISNAVVYADKPKLKEQFKNGRLHARFTQKFSIIADRDFTIPALQVDYFDLKTKKIVHLHSKPISIKVLGAVVKESQQIAEAPMNQPNQKIVYMKNRKSEIFIFFAGFIAGIAIALIGFFLLRWKPLKKSFSFANKKELLNKLLPHVADNEEARAMAKALYEEIYEGKKHRISKKDVEELLKNLM
ncbi:MULTISPECIES: BatD family protein [unclassified Nitratiruptor]|uniref:BatD family protein n=1 Tax=unclassified Nitratiruptor TaxID=2624044 RepID=UPI001914F680|nr:MULTISPECIES: BatD family protein [unclassified Nitratiruptor]BCD59743.1 hypothetical protein NitYY0810_C0499 [Nitratiruptor sp. YY08-10]BCD63667.1 hypothetical protein NitYY0814_C0499 [Nitratiruptor sp. YY08-14]